LSRAKAPRRRYKYDVALSFAGEDRTLAAELSRHLKRFGLSVFYDTDHQAELWGKNTEAFARIYGPQSRYVISLVSAHYAHKDWTQFEFDSARREQRKRGREFILPVRLDDTRLLGLPDSKIRIDARERSAAQIAKLFAEKCAVQSRSTSQASGPVRAAAVALLRSDRRRSLGLIAAAAVPLPMAYFEKLFPKYNWRRLVAGFAKAGLTREASGAIELRRPALQALRSDSTAFRELNDLWIDRLSRLRGHVDTTAFLVMHLITAGRFEEAAQVAVSVASDVAQGSWTGVYLTLLRALRRRRPFRALSRQTRLELLNTLGITLAHGGEHSEAARVFSDLRRLSRSYHSSWGTGQALINAGVAAHNLGNAAVSIRMYEEAVSHARKSHDDLLLGRALSNLAQSVQNEDLPRAERLLEESLRAKARARDVGGLAIGRAVSAGIAVSKRDFVRAAQVFKKASTAFLRLGMRHEHALSIYNQGRALQDAGERRAAIRLFQRARAIAEQGGFADVLRLALNALGATAFEQGEFERSRDYGEALLAAARRVESDEDVLGALHMLAVSHLALGNESEAKARFRQAIGKARKRHAHEFLSRCLVDSTRSKTRGGVSDPERIRLERIAKREHTLRSPVAAHIWRAIARVAAADGREDEVASKAYRTAIRLLSFPSVVPLRVDFSREHFAWAWRRRRYDEALCVLEDIERRQSRADPRNALAALDERGVCLQKLGRHKDAEPLHRRAAERARRVGEREQEERSLNNLGEALRAQNRCREAINAFRKSEAIAVRGRRYEEALSTAHNRALALEQGGDRRNASLLLRRCRDEARRRHLWREYVRGLEGLGRLAWLDGQPGQSLVLYERGMREAQRRELRELQPQIALSIARLKLGANRAKEGLALLKRFQGAFLRLTDAHDYLATVAGLQNAVGQTTKALESWRASKRHAQALGDLEHVRYCEQHEASIQASIERVGLSEASLRTALTVERRPDGRAALLIQLVTLLLTRKKAVAAQVAFADALRLCGEAHLDARKSELYMAVADSTLSGDRSQQLESLKAYLMALISAIERDADAVADLGSQITFRLASADSGISRDRLQSLIRDLRSTVRKELPGASADVRRLLLWPFDLAAQLARFRNQPEQMQEAVAQFANSTNVRRYLSTGRLHGRTRRRAHAGRASL